MATPHNAAELLFSASHEDINTKETLELIHQDMFNNEYARCHTLTMEDTMRGMCPENYHRTTKQVRDVLRGFWERQNYPRNSTVHEHINDYTVVLDCNADSDCPPDMRCCPTVCGKKCRPPIFSEEEYKKAMFI